VSARLHRAGWEVRWRDADGRQRASRFPSEEAARVFDEALAEVPLRPPPGHRPAGRSGGVYPYRTGDAVRW